jgi:hypothetical protein
MSDAKEKLEQALDGIDESKRATLTRLLTGTAFVTPIVASFAMDGLTISKAQAQARNGSGVLPVSDRRLKTGISKVTTLSSGLSLYRFRYLWSDVEYVGVMAQEALDFAPDCVSTGPDGFYRVDYAALGTEMTTYAAWKGNNALAAMAAPAAA